MLFRQLACAVIVVLATGAIANAEPLKPGTQIVYRGSVGVLKSDGGTEAGKSFDLTLLVAGQENAPVLYWLVAERGRGEMPWLLRFGQTSLGAKLEGAGPDQPALLFDYGTGTSAIPLPIPLLQTETQLAAGATFTRGGLEHEVQAAEKRGDHEVWRISARSGFGRKRNLWLDQKSPLIVALDERVFLNMGTEHLLKMELVASEPLEPAEFEKNKKAFEQILAVRGKLNLPADAHAFRFSPEQRALLTAQVPLLAKEITTGPLAKLLKVAVADLEGQTGEAGAVSELAAKYRGQKVDKFDIKDVSGKAVTAKDLDGHVTVLHFWSYRDQPLEEPYGQVGYLEFLRGRYEKRGMKLYGVAVDSRLDTNDERKAAIGGIKRLQSFMNLSYPILLDGGKLIDDFGDPRSVGAELPLYVVLGPDRKIVHYHVGYHEVDRQVGLKELDAAVSSALEANKPDEKKADAKKPEEKKAEEKK